MYLFFSLHFINKKDSWASLVFVVVRILNLFFIFCFIIVDVAANIFLLIAFRFVLFLLILFLSFALFLAYFFFCCFGYVFVSF